MRSTSQTRQVGWRSLVLTTLILPLCSPAIVLDFIAWDGWPAIRMFGDATELLLVMPTFVAAIASGVLALSRTSAAVRRRAPTTSFVRLLGLEIVTLICVLGALLYVVRRFGSAEHMPPYFMQRFEL